jgi:hypothetical protein
MDLSQPQAEDAVPTVESVKNSAIVKSGNFIRLLQETPKVRMSHCQAWRCMPRKRTGDSVIRSNCRFMLRETSVSSSIEKDPYILDIEIC